MPQPPKPTDRIPASGLAVMIGLPAGGPPKPLRKPYSSSAPAVLYPDEVGYLSPEQRCSSCSHFEPKDSRCGRYGFECEPNGGCPRGFMPKSMDDRDEAIDEVDDQDD